MKIKKTPPSDYVHGEKHPSAETKLSLVILFFDSNFKGIDQNLLNHVVISTVTEYWIIEKVLIDQGSSTNILYLPTFKKMQLLESSLKPYHGDLIEFSSEFAKVCIYVKLCTTLIWGQNHTSKSYISSTL